MSNKPDEILQSIYGRLNNLNGIVEVRKSRVEPPKKYPGVIIRMGTDTPLNSNTAFQNWELIVNTDVYVNSTEDNLDSQTLEIRKQVHSALMNEQSLGLSFVQSIDPLGQSEPDYTGEGQDYAGATRYSWLIRYRTNFFDLS